MRNQERLFWVAVGAALVLCLIAVLSLAVYVHYGRQRLAAAVTRYLAEPTATVAGDSGVPPDETPARPKLSIRSLLPLVLEGRSGQLTATLTPCPTPTAGPPTATPEPTSKPKKTPKPTKTPTLPWPDALAAPGLSKLGLHVQWNNSPEIMEYVRRIKPPVIKTVGDFGFLADLKRESPSTLVIGRLQEFDRQHGISLEGDPLAAAQNYVAQRLETYQANPLVDYWEGINEPGVQGRMAWFAAFEAERVRIMAQHGFRCTVGTFSAGVPEWEEFEAFLPAVQAAKEHGGIMALHEYDAPTLNRSAGAGLPNHPNYADRGALALRYRWWYEDFLKPRGLVIPLVISEAGVDGLIGNRPGPKGHGWQDFAGYWADQGLGNDDIAAYLAQLAWYDSELRKDDYVLGCAVFTAGPMGDDWESYDITDMLRQLAHYAVKLQ